MSPSCTNLLPIRCQKIHGRGWRAEYANRVSQYPAIVRRGGTMTIDLAKGQSHEAKMAIIHVLGLAERRAPRGERPGLLRPPHGDGRRPRQEAGYLDSIAPRISRAALCATEARLDELAEADWFHYDRKSVTNFDGNIDVRVNLIPPPCRFKGTIDLVFHPHEAPAPCPAPLSERGRPARKGIRPPPP